MQKYVKSAPESIVLAQGENKNGHQNPAHTTVY